MVILIGLLFNEVLEGGYGYSKDELMNAIIFWTIIGLVIGGVLVLAMHGYCDYRIRNYLINM